MQKGETRSMSVTPYKYQLKVSSRPNVRPGTLKLLQERAGNTLEFIGIGNDFRNSDGSATKKKD
jgi:hypothetical protein